MEISTATILGLAGLLAVGGGFIDGLTDDVSALKVETEKIEPGIVILNALTSDVAVLKSNVLELKDDMSDVGKTLNRMDVTLGRIDERAKVFKDKTK